MRFQNRRGIPPPDFGSNIEGWPLSGQASQLRNFLIRPDPFLPRHRLAHFMDCSRMESSQVTDRVRLSELGKRRASRGRSQTGEIVNIPRHMSSGQTVEVPRKCYSTEIRDRPEFIAHTSKLTRRGARTMRQIPNANLKQN